MEESEIEQDIISSQAVGQYSINHVKIESAVWDEFGESEITLAISKGLKPDDQYSTKESDEKD